MPPKKWERLACVAAFRLRCVQSLSEQKHQKDISIPLALDGVDT